MYTAEKFEIEIRGTVGKLNNYQTESVRKEGINQ